MALCFHKSDCFNLGNLIVAVKIVIIETVTCFTAKMKTASAHFNITIMYKSVPHFVHKSSASPIRIENFVAFYCYHIIISFNLIKFKFSWSGNVVMNHISFDIILALASGVPQDECLIILTGFWVVHSKVILIR